ncbi:MAG: efflux RND transporter permease subunit [Hyphomicrobium sp.]
MLHRLVEFSLTQRTFVLALGILLAIWGGISFQKIPIDAFPDISVPQVKIILKAPGMTPEEVETRVIFPIEIELLGIPYQVILRSAAKYGIADITIDFEDGTDIYWARQQVNERLSGVREILPTGVSGGLAPISTPLSEVLMFTVEGTNYSLAERRALLDWSIRPALRTIPGVADVNSLGGFVRTFEVAPNNEALAAAGLSVSSLANIIQASNRNDGSGRLWEGEKALVVRAEGAIKSLQDLEQVVVRNEHGRVVRVSDVAEVRQGNLTRYGGVSSDGQGEIVEGIVLSLRGANAYLITKAVHQKLEDLKSLLPEGVRISIFYDRSDLVLQAIKTVYKALLEATILVILLLILFLGNFRAALIVAMSLPLSALFAFILLYNFGMSANLMSLGGLAIAIGLIVDAAVVVVENTDESLNLEHHQSVVPVLHRIFKAVEQVSLPVASGILIIGLVFLPLLTLQGLEGKLFSPVAITIVLALFGALLLSLTFIPVACSFILKVHTNKQPFLMRILGKIYSRILNLVLRKPAIIYTTAVLSLLVSGLSFTNLGKSFMPTLDEGSIIIQSTKLPSINLQASLEGDLTLQKQIMSSLPEVKRIVSRVGTDELGLDPMSPNESDNFLELKPKELWSVPTKEQLIDKLRKVVSILPGIQYTFTQPIEMRTSEMLTGARGDLAVKIFGPDLRELAKLAMQVQKLIQSIPGAAEVVTADATEVDYLRIKIDRLASGRTGLSSTRVQDDLRVLIEGMNAGSVIQGNRRIPIVIKGKDEIRESPELFSTTQMVAEDGGLVRIGDVASLLREAGPVKINRENTSRYALIQAYVRGRDLVGFVNEAQKSVEDNLKLPNGYRIFWGGEFENQRRASARLLIVVPIALGLIFVVLFATLRSIQQSLLILSNIPFALVGGILALALTGEYLSVPASVGFIALLGIAVLNALVLISYYNHLSAMGLPIEKVVYEGAMRRLRPVLMTASIAAFGLLPILFQTGPGSEIQRPLAIVVIGGLVSSTSLTLLLLPVLYRRFAFSKNRDGTEKSMIWRNPFQIS